MDCPSCLAAVDIRRPLQAPFVAGKFAAFSTTRPTTCCRIGIPTLRDFILSSMAYCADSTPSPALSLSSLSSPASDDNARNTPYMSCLDASAYLPLPIFTAASSHVICSIEVLYM